MFYRGWIFHLQNDFSKSEEFLLKAIELSNNEFKYYYWLAEIYWFHGDEKYRNDKKFILTNLLRSAKLNPNSSESFASLGRYYEKHANDIDRAIKCYQKSLLLDSFNELASQSLSEIFIQQNNQEGAIQIYKSLLKKSSGVDWAWKKLGFYYLNHSANTSYLEEAINCFQNVLRSKSDDFECLEGLAIAYRLQGMYIASLRVFEKIYEKHPNDKKITYYMGNLYFILGLYQQALEYLQSVISSSSDDDGGENENDHFDVDGFDLFYQCKIEIAYCYFSIAQEEFNDGLFTRCGNSLYNASKIILHVNFNENEKQIQTKNQSSSLSHFSHFSLLSLYKLKGDIFSFGFLLSEDHLLSIESPDSIQSQTDENYKSLTNKKIWALESCLAYQKGCEISPDNAFIHYDLGVSFWQRAQLFSNFINEKKEFLNQSKNYFKKSISICPTEVKFWNALGSVECNPSIKQHIFIRALEIDPTCAISWCNLMCFYIQHNQYELASKTHEKVITYDPDLPKLWTSFALLKELQNENQINSNSSSSSIFIHNLEEYYKFACTLDSKSIFSKQSLAFYASDPHISIFILQKSLEQSPNDPTSWNLLGLMQEKVNQYSKSLQSFKKSQEIIQSSIQLNKNDKNKQEIIISTLKCKTFEENKFSIENLIKIKLNIARILCKLNNYQLSIDYYNEILLFIKNQNLEIQSLFYCLSLFKINKIEDCFLYFNKILQLNEENSSIYSILFHDFCRFHFFNSSNSCDDFKDNIYNSLEQFAIDKNIYQSWKLICAFDIELHHCKTLQHIHHLQVHPDVSIQDYLLEVHFYMKENDLQNAKKALFKALHIEPYNFSIRAILIEFLSIYYPNDTKNIWQAVKNFNPSLCNRTTSSNRYEFTEISNEWTQAAKALLIMGKERNLSSKDVLLVAKRNIQKAIHFSPFNFISRFTAAAIAFAMAIIDGSSLQYNSSILFIQKTIDFFNNTQKDSDSSNDNLHSILLFHCNAMLAEILLLSKKYDRSTQILNQLNDKKHSNQIPIDTLNRLQVLTFRAEFLNSKLTNEQIMKQLHSIDKLNPEVSLELISLLSHSPKKEEGDQVSIQKDMFLKLLSFLPKMNLGDRLLVLLCGSLFFYRTNDFSIAVKVADDGFKFSGRRSDCFVLMKGAIHVALKDWKNAIQTLQRCLVINPTIPFANYLLMQIHFQLRKYQEAETDALYELDNNPLFYEPYLLLSNLAKTAKKTDIAKRFFVKAKVLAPHLVSKQL